MLTFGGPQSYTPARSSKPPGGKASISLSWGNDARQSPRKERVPATSSRATITSSAGKSSTRVSAPPGGLSNLSLAWDEACERASYCTPSSTRKSSSSVSGFHTARDHGTRRQREEASVTMDMQWDVSDNRSIGCTRTPCSRKSASVTSSRGLRSVQAPPGETPSAYSSALDDGFFRPPARRGGSLSAPSGKASKPSGSRGYGAESCSSSNPAPRSAKKSLVAPSPGAASLSMASEFARDLPEGPPREYEGRFTRPFECESEFSQRTPKSARSKGGSSRGPCGQRHRASEDELSYPCFTPNQRGYPSEPSYTPNDQGRYTSEPSYTPSQNRYCGSESTRTRSQGRYASESATPSQYRPRCHAESGSRTPGAPYTPSYRAAEAWGDDNASESSSPKKQVLYKRRPAETPTTATGTSAYCDSYDTDNISVRTYETPRRSATAPRLRPESQSKAEIEGSRPKVWKPGRTPRAPPGGRPQLGSPQDNSYDDLYENDDSHGAGSGKQNARAYDASRFHQDAPLRAKQPGSSKNKPEAEKRARESHRYYVEVEERTGKLRSHSQSKVNRHNLLGLNDDRFASQSTSAASYDDVVSEADSLPLGAEWCSF